jgi:hypothetical protein
MQQEVDLGQPLEYFGPGLGLEYFEREQYFA